MTPSQLTSLLILAHLLATAQADAATYKATSIGYNNLKEYAYLGTDPYVEKNNVTLSTILGYKKPYSNYQAELGIAAGTHRSGSITNPQKTTSTNYILSTTHTLTTSKRFNQFEPEVGIDAYAAIAKINNRAQLKSNSIIGLAYYPNADTKLGLRIQKALYNQFFYQDYDLSQPNSTTYTSYIEKQTGRVVKGIALGFQQSKEGKHQYHKGLTSYEPDNQEVMLKLYKKNL